MLNDRGGEGRISQSDELPATQNPALKFHKSPPIGGEPRKVSRLDEPEEAATLASLFAPSKNELKKLKLWTHAR